MEFSQKLYLTKIEKLFCANPNLFWKDTGQKAKLNENTFFEIVQLFGPDHRILIRKTDCFSFLADVLLEDSLKKSDNILDIFNYITRCTLDIILETAMGQAMGIQLAREST